MGVPTTLPNGDITMIQTVYTQTFAAVPDQLPSPVEGSIGMGTLTGAIGVVRTEQAKTAGAPPAVAAPLVGGVVWRWGLEGLGGAVGVVAVVGGMAGWWV